MPVGTSLRARPAKKKKPNTMMAEAHINKTTLLIANNDESLSQIAGHSIRWLIGGKSMPTITTDEPPRCAHRGARQTVGMGVSGRGRPATLTGGGSPRTTARDG